MKEEKTKKEKKKRGRKKKKEKTMTTTKTAYLISAIVKEGQGSVLIGDK